MCILRSLWCQWPARQLIQMCTLINIEIHGAKTGSFSPHYQLVGETFFISSSPPHFRCFYGNEKNILFIDIEQAISQ